ncbi:hypothetical protein BH20ACT18_BH20ACT18_10040 [soil metagenome]
MIRSSAEPPEKVPDPSDLRLRRRSITIGIVLSLVVCAVSSVYYAATADGPHRTLLPALSIAAAVASAGIALLPLQRILRSRRPELFFLGWSGALTGVITVGAALDGGASSPLALLLFLPLIFAAMNYAPREMLAVGGASVVFYALLAALVGDPEGAYVAFFSACLAITAVMCAWQARNHEEQRGELARVSRADPLTGSLNRRGFEERLAAELNHSTRSARPLGLVLIDLDDFKQVNDTKGHAAGDELLAWVAETVRGVVRPRDAVGRLGGDEFALVLPETGQADSLATARRVREALGDRIEACTGVGAFPADGGSAEELLRRADSALYASKHGRFQDVGPARADLSWAAAMAGAVDRRMAGTHQHSSAVARYAVMIAERLGYSEAQLGQLRVAAMLHDVGKVALPDDILRKAGPLTLEEYDQMRTHPNIGADMVSRIDGLSSIVPWVRHSHEHWDGSGYPHGLKEARIPLPSRILFVADALEAMTSERPYRSPMDLADALAELELCAGSQFDPQCVALLVEALAPVSQS